MWRVVGMVGSSAVVVMLITASTAQAQDMAQTDLATTATQVSQITDLLGIGLPVLSALLLGAVIALWRRLWLVTDAHLDYLRGRVSLLEREHDTRNSVVVQAADAKGHAGISTELRAAVSASERG